MHCEKNFPLRKQQSDLDVGLECGLNDEQYLNTVKDYLPWLLDTFIPDLVLYDAGVDPHQDDALGKLNLTDQGTVKERMASVFGRLFHIVMHLCCPIYGRRFPIDSALAWHVVYSDIYVETRNSRTRGNTLEQSGKPANKIRNLNTGCKVI